MYKFFIILFIVISLYTPKLTSACDDQKLNLLLSSSVYKAEKLKADYSELYESKMKLLQKYKDIPMPDYVKEVLFMIKAKMKYIEMELNYLHAIHIIVRK